MATEKKIANVTLVALYRFYNSDENFHRYTTSTERANEYRADGAFHEHGIIGYLVPEEHSAEDLFQADLIGVPMPLQPGDPVGGGAEILGYGFSRASAQESPFHSQLEALYMVDLAGAGGVLYTTDKVEYQSALEAGGQDLGIACYTFPAVLDGTAGVISGMYLGKSGVFLRSTDVDFEARWAQVASELEVETLFTETVDVHTDARYWGMLESALLQDFEAHTSSMARQLARLELMFDQYSGSMNLRLQATLGDWINHFKNQMEVLVNSTVSQIVERQVATKIAIEAMQIKNSLALEINTDIDARIDTAIATALEQAKDEIEIDVLDLGKIGERIDERIDLELGNTGSEVSAELVNNIEQIVEVVLAQRIDQLQIDTENEFDLQLVELANELTQIQSDLSGYRLRADARLKGWAAQALIDLKGCTMDRAEFVQQLRAFVTDLQGDLNGTSCVDENRWQDPVLSAPAP